VRANEVVLVAEDDDDMRAIVEDVLQANGFVVLSARDGAEAIARLYAYTGRVLAIVDLMMAGRSGEDLIRDLRARALGASTRIIVVTGSDVEHVDGADRVLRKPCSMATLLRVVQELSQT